MALDDQYLVADKVYTEPEVIIMVALPRSGKSTFVNNKVKQGYVPVCKDDIRRYHGYRFNISEENKIKDLANYQLEIHLIRGLNVIIDETNLTRSKRAEIIEICKKYGVRWKIIEIISPHYEELKKRCTNTNFPLEVLDELISKYERIEIDEIYQQNNDYYINISP